MGHAIGGGFLKATTKEAAMKEGLKDAEEFAYYNVDRQENYSGSYYNSFKYYDKVFNTEEEAMEFFYSLGSYCDGVCMVKEPSKGAKTRYMKRMSNLEQKKRNFVLKTLEKFKERTSSTVGCKKCGTRITKEIAIQRKLFCPNCNNWLVSDTVKERMRKFDEEKESIEEIFAKDCAETGKPRYFAKYEVHC